VLICLKSPKGLWGRSGIYQATVLAQNIEESAQVKVEEFSNSSSATVYEKDEENLLLI
jgi:hypothetical protein